MPQATLDLPPVRVLARQAVPRILEGVVIPTLLFLGLLRLGGLPWAVVGALVWSTLVIGSRLALGRRVPTLVIIGLGALAVRTSLALAAGSSFVYFLQPTVGTAVAGVVILGSAMAGRPVILRIAGDFCPIPEDAMTHGHVRRFILGLSVLWGTVQLVNAGVTLWLLLSQSLGTFVLVRTTLAYSLTAFAIAVTVWSFRRLARATAPVPALVPALVST